jgi:hypothetical protein
MYDTVVRTGDTGISEVDRIPVFLKLKDNTEVNSKHVVTKIQEVLKIIERVLNKREIKTYLK